MRLLILFLILAPFLVFSQESGSSINEQLISVSFETKTEAKKAPFLHFKKTSSYFNPFIYLGAGMLFVYQNIFSEQIQADCAYEISCSEFTKRSIHKHGFFKGTLRGFNQLSECSPTALYEHEPVNVNGRQKIINRLEEDPK
jgi:putative component of membrane protein insertase Oxa1/YidC/SpoIIIJ protein YidD